MSIQVEAIGGRDYTADKKQIKDITIKSGNIVFISKESPLGVEHFEHSNT